MDRLKDFRNWILIVIAFYIVSNGLIYANLHSDELGVKWYNLTHQNEIVNEAK